MKWIKGETLVEVTVSLGIIAIALAGATTLIASVTHTVTNNKLRTQGTAYAEEGTEIAVSDIRNCNCITNTTWTNFRVSGTDYKLEKKTSDFAIGNPDYQIGSTGFYRVVKLKQLDPLVPADVALLPPGVDPLKYWKVDSIVKWNVDLGNDGTEVITLIRGEQ